MMLLYVPRYTAVVGLISTAMDPSRSQTMKMKNEIKIGTIYREREREWVKNLVFLSCSAIDSRKSYPRDEPRIDLSIDAYV